MRFFTVLFKYLDKAIFGTNLVLFWVIWSILTLSVLVLIPYGNTNESLIYLFLMLGVFLIKLFDAFLFGGSESFKDFISHFSRKRVADKRKGFSFSGFIIPLYFITIYIAVPVALESFIGGWVFLFFPIWAIGNYIFAERSARQREHMPMLEHTEAIGIMLVVIFPTFLSFIGTLLYYFFW